MNRLRDQRGSADPTVARAARLLSSRAPLADDVGRQQRVRARLRRRRRVPFAASLLRVALLIAVICSVAAASAMIGRVAKSIRARLQAASAAKAETRTPSHRRRAASAAPPLAAPPLAAAPAAAAPASAPASAPVAPSAVAAPPPAPLRAAPPRTAPAAHAPSETDEQRLLTSAVRALRHEHDPARAATLFARYLDRYPDGIATEDALALGLEATLGRDRARATSFATRYLSRYPSGRWSTLARRALEP
jgi:TolA-binding protein